MRDPRDRDPSSAVTPEIQVERLSESTSPDLVRDLDRILAACGRGLVRSGEELASVSDRIFDAAEDRHRILLCARKHGDAAGIMDAVLHTPEPSDLTIGQIAVAERFRHRGLARALVHHALLCASDDVSVTRVLASVHTRNHGARMFWERIGFDAVQAQRNSTITVMTRSVP